MSASILSVSELSSSVRQCLERTFPLLWVSGEVSNLTRASSGHVYFSIKDENAQIRCVMFRNRAQLVGWQIANGQQVEINARVAFYEPRGDFQLNIEGMRRAGLGRLYETFARLRQALTTEGLFALERKLAIPAFPQQIGIISSPRAAALQDVLVTLQRRAPYLPVIVFPTPVQGVEAAPGIVAALAAAHRHGQCDVLLMVRGGGSIEDLWAFNEEATIRAIAARRIPVVTGIGHETDLTLADLAADQHGTTPTAAAELVTTHWYSAQTTINHLEHALKRAITRPIDQLRQRLDLATAQLLHPRERVTRARDRLAHLRSNLLATIRHQVASHKHELAQVSQRTLGSRPKTESASLMLNQLRYRLGNVMGKTARNQQQRVERLGHALELLSPMHTLARGYAVVRAGDGTVALTPGDLPPDQIFSVQLAHGQLMAVPIADDTKPD